MRKAAEVTGVVVGCAEDMKALWEDNVVQEMLRRKKVRMEEEPGLCVLSSPPSPPRGTRSRTRIELTFLKQINSSFLNDIERIATRDYEPSDHDVIRARLRTLGVQEYRFWVEQSTAPLGATVIISHVVY